jgi:putative spermidine/putrescine transport system ATP-binding protein
VTLRVHQIDTDTRWNDRLRARDDEQDGGRPRDGAASYLEFRDVCKTYDGVGLAVANLNCTVEKGEFLTFLGPSGSGKTTALMMLAGFEMLSAGDILLGGRSVAQTPPHRRDMGVVFQNYALFPHMTVAENVAFPLRARRYPAAEISSRVAQALQLVRLTGFEARRPAQLSGGQQQRVALARALVFDPAVVLMDEPLGALDRQLREQLQLEIKSIQAQLGLTVIYVTHDQSEAMTMSNRIAVFNNGEVQQIASPFELYERPRNAFVAGFVGESNRIKGVIAAIQDDGSCIVRTDGGRTVRAAPVGDAVPGMRATLSIRPEKIAFEPRAEQRQNLVEATVEELIYHGADTRVRLRLPGDGHVFARIASIGTEIEIRPGDTVAIGWRVQDCIAFTGPASSGGAV